MVGGTQTVVTRWSLEMDLIFVAPTDNVDVVFFNPHVCPLTGRLLVPPGSASGPQVSALCCFFRGTINHLSAAE